MSLEDRVSSLESGLQDIRSILQDISAKIVSPEQTSAEPAPTITPTPEAPAINSTPDTPIQRSVINPTEDAQATFASIKASVQHVRLPAELTLASSGASGLKKVINSLTLYLVRLVATQRQSSRYFKPKTILMRIFSHLFSL